MLNFYPSGNKSSFIFSLKEKDQELKIGSESAYLKEWSWNDTNDNIESLPTFSGRIEKYTPQTMIELNMTFDICPTDYWMSQQEYTFTSKLKNKKIKDCNVQELLYAARQQMKGQMKDEK